MRLQVLGPLRLERDGDEIPLTSGRQRALLANLVLAGGSSVAADQLIEAVWGGDLPSNPANTLQHGIAQLRKILEPGRRRSDPPQLLVSDGAGYRLDLAGAELDAAEFEQSLYRAEALLKAGSAGAARDQLRAALSLWRGRAYADFMYSNFAQAEAERLEELRTRARELLIDATSAVDGPESVVADLEALVADFPFREGLWARLMTALYQSGRQAEALRTYQVAADALGEELGIEPSVELRELENRILLQDPGLAAPRRGPAQHNLPLATTPLIGRADTLARVIEATRANRLVSLLGPGGSGKTRLAIEAARELSDDFGDGTWLVRLDDLLDPSLAVSAVGEVMGMPEDRERPVTETLAGFIGDKRVLLVMDNCEHLVECVAELAEALLVSCGRLTILATSQVALQVGGEQRIPVPPLGLPGADGAVFVDIAEVPAVALFLARATAANPDMEVSPATLAAVANIVQALDGMPLAIELAAARTDLLTPVEIARRLADRFEILGTGPREVPERQRTLRAAVEWSYGLMDPAEQDFFNRLGVFAGSFNAAAAAAVAGTSEAEALGMLGALMQRSLIYRDPDRTVTSRYRLLETLRLFCTAESAAAGTLSTTRDRHLDYYAELVRRLDAKLIGPRQLEAFGEMVLEQDNVRSALAWSLESERHAPGVAIAAWMGRFWDWRGSLAEAATWTARFLSAQPEPTIRYAALLTSWASYFAWELGDEDRAATLSARAVETGELGGDPFGVSVGYSGVAMLARARGDYSSAIETNQLIRELAAAAGNDWMSAWADNHDGLCFLAAGDPAAAHRAAASSRAAYEAMGDSRATGWALTVLAQIAVEEGDAATARSLAEEAVAVSRAAGDGRNAAWALELAGEAAAALGDVQSAELLAAQAAELLQERGMPQSPWRRV